MRVDLEEIQRWFDRYTRSFDLSVSMIEMKRRHSLGVMRVGERVARALSWPEDEARTGIAACLLHDTGRFTQYRDFGTYYDGVSIDHGERGFEVLRAELFCGPDGRGGPADDEGREAVLQAVRWHNKKELPADIPRGMAPFCRLARDADKLDVFALVRSRMEEGTVGDLLPRHKIDAPLSPRLLDEVEAYGSGSYKNAFSLLDFLLIQLTWALDLNFVPSLQIIEESGVLSSIRDRFPKDDERIQNILGSLFSRIEKRERELKRGEVKRNDNGNGNTRTGNGIDL
ncbi:MAG: HD domain-containing protein [Synergistaceae bacterium]|nr:HD domain-containing protein [Synergistaceae bacterium]